MPRPEKDLSTFIGTLMKTINLQFAVPKEEYEGEDPPVIIDPESGDIVGVLYDTEQAEHLSVSFDCVKIFGLSTHSMMERLIAAKVPMESFVPSEMLPELDTVEAASQKADISGLSAEDANALTSLEGFPFPIVSRETGGIIGWAKDRDCAILLSCIDAVLDTMESMRDVFWLKCISVGIDPSKDSDESN